ncbi:hypothetical protein D3C81_1119540 [compost metagenome]
MTGKHWLAAVLQPLVQGANVFRFRAVAVTVQLFVFDDRDAAGIGQRHQRLRLIGQTVEDILRRVDHRLIEQRQGFDFFFTLTADLQRFHGANLQRQYLADGLARRTQLMRHVQWLTIAATDQAPKLVTLEQGNAHRRQHAHVFHVLAVDRRHTAQGGETQVQRRVRVRAQLRHQRYRLVVGIGDDPQPIGAIQLTRLFGNVRRREKQAIEHFHRRVGGFGDHLTVALLLETIDQHPVVTGHGLNFLDADVIQRLQRGGPLQTLEHAPQMRLIAGDIARLEIFHVDFQLQNQHTLMAVQQTLECRAVEPEAQRLHIGQRRLQ